MDNRLLPQTLDSTQAQTMLIRIFVSYRPDMDESEEYKEGRATLLDWLISIINDAEKK